MKKSGKCPKCDSTDIGHRREKNGRDERAFYPGWTALSATTPELYYCRDCGFFEEYLSDRQIYKLG